MLLGNTKEGFTTIEFESVTFVKNCQSDGVPLPKLFFELPELDQSMETSVSVLDASKSETVVVPDEGVAQVFCRYSDSHVRELRFMASTGGSSFMKSITQYKDGTSIFTKIDALSEIVGYYGYLDEKQNVMALGLIVMNHV